MTYPTVACLILAVSLPLCCCVPWTVRPINDAKESDPGLAALSPSAYVDSIWTAKLVPAVMNQAVDARVLLDSLAKSPADALARYGHREANGPTYFIVKGQGIVVNVDTRSRSGLALVDIPPYHHRPDISIQIGPVLRGTSLRDATGIVRFTDFVNQLQFADVGNELNDHVLKTVLANVDKAQLAGRTVSFAGTLPAEVPADVPAEVKAEPPLHDVVPVKLQVEERAR